MDNIQQLPTKSSFAETLPGALHSGWWYGSEQNAQDSPVQEQLQQQQCEQLQNHQQPQHHQQELQSQVVHQQQRQYLRPLIHQQQLDQQQLHRQQQLLCSTQQQNSVQTNNPSTVGVSPSGKATKVVIPRARTAFSYFVQTCREEHKKMFPKRRQCYNIWMGMEESEKKCFLDMAKKDKERYELETKNFVQTKGGMPVGRVVKRKQFKDPNAPKRPLPAFLLFMRDERDKVKALNPGIGMCAIAKELGRMWSTIHPDVKQWYLTKAQQNKREYNQQMVVYKLKAAGCTVVVKLPNHLQSQPVQTGVAGEFQNLPWDEAVSSSSSQLQIVKLE